MEWTIFVRQAYMSHIYSFHEYVQVVELRILRHQYGTEWALGKIIARGDIAVGV